MSKQLTVRNVPLEVAEALKKLSRERDESVNGTVLHILKQALGIDERRKHLLQRYATWTEEDAAGFEGALHSQRQLHERDWS